MRLSDSVDPRLVSSLEDIIEGKITDPDQVRAVLKWGDSVHSNLNLLYSRARTVFVCGEPYELSTIGDERDVPVV